MIRDDVFKVLVERGVVKDNKFFFRTSMLVNCPYRWLHQTEISEAMVRGSRAHELWQQKLRTDGWLTEYEVSLPLTSDVFVVGHLDAYHPKKHIILEAKTSKTVYWMHTRQLEIYRWLLWRLTGKIPEAFLVYLDENGNEKHRVKPFLANMAWVEAYVLGRVRTIAKHLLEHGDMPRIPDKLYCPYCEFYHNCREAKHR